ncbi:MAG: hypothetical protein HQK55_10415 [Deltaproteobacteria bacterium]|nr:hypothetical protein [Deltaproteobacteria bacterium]
MKIPCQSCQAILNIPDDRLAPGMDFSFNCPRCKNKNTIHVPEGETSETVSFMPDTPPDHAPIKPSPREAPSPTSANQTHPPATSVEEEDGMVGEFYEDGAKLALICFDDGPMRDNLKNQVLELGYVPVIPASGRDTLQRLRVTQFNLILLHESYDGQSPTNNSVLQFIQPMEMTTRRRVVLILFGQNFSTLDHMTAYSMSVNAVANLADEAHFGKIIRRATAEHERFYRVYFDVMREMSKI